MPSETRDIHGDLEAARTTAQETASELAPKRARLAEVEARDAHCASEQDWWERKRLDADATGNDRAIGDADARLAALAQARRRNTSTLARLRVELAEGEGRLSEAMGQEALAREQMAVAAAIDRVEQGDAALMLAVRTHVAPLLLMQNEAVQDAVEAEREACRCTGRTNPATARVIDRIQRSAPAALIRLSVLQRIVNDEALEVGTTEPRTVPAANSALARLRRGGR